MQIQRHRFMRTKRMMEFLTAYSSREKISPLQVSLATCQVDVRVALHRSPHQALCTR